MTDTQTPSTPESLQGTDIFNNSNNDTSSSSSFPSHIPNIESVFVAPPIHQSSSNSCFSPIAQSYINQSKTLSFSLYPRPDPRFIPPNKSTPGTIDHIHCPTRLPSEMKMYMIMIGKQLGLDSMSTTNREILINAILITKSYLEGYAISMGSICSFMRWNEELKKKTLGLDTMQSVRDMFRDKSGNKTLPYSQKIQLLYPSLLYLLSRFVEWQQSK